MGCLFLQAAFFIAYTPIDKYYNKILLFIRILILPLVFKQL